MIPGTAEAVGRANLRMSVLQKWWDGTLIVDDGMGGEVVVPCRERKVMVEYYQLGCWEKLQLRPSAWVTALFIVIANAAMLQLTFIGGACK